MGRRSNIEQLPAITRQLLDAELEKNAFSNLVRIADDFRARGWKVTKSALHRYSQKRRELLQRAMHEAEVIKRLEPTEAFLLRWARANPKAAARLVKRLQKQQDKERSQP